MDKFREYLLGSKFTVFTDNNPLYYIQKPTKKLGATEMRWIADLAQFDFDIKYRSGKTNVVADALSRQPEEYKNCIHMEDVSVCFEQLTQTVKIPLELHLEADAVNLEVDVPEVAAVIPTYSPAEMREFQLKDSDVATLIDY